MGAASIFYWLSNEVQGQCEWDERALCSAGAWWEAGVWAAGSRGPEDGRERPGGKPAKKACLRWDLGPFAVAYK